MSSEPDETAEAPEIEEQKNRVAALLLTLPGWNRNYTATVDAAAWLIHEAARVGWTLAVVAK
jgi:hypothetical protein